MVSTITLTTTGPDLSKAHNRLELLKRRPSDLRRYLAWSHETKLSHGSITNFVVKERLHWIPLQPGQLGPDSFSHRSEIPFQDPSDYTILINDWPYGFIPAISHILVWSRTPVAVDSMVGDVTPDSRALIESFVHDRFVKRIAMLEDISIETAAKRVLWFKNWVSLQSVRGVDHIHVLVRDVAAINVQQLIASDDD